MPTFWLSRIQRWLLYPLAALNMPGATHTPMEAVLNSLSVTVMGTPNQALFGCLVAHSNSEVRRPLPFTQTGDSEPEASKLGRNRQVALSQEGLRALITALLNVGNSQTPVHIPS